MPKKHHPEAVLGAEDYRIVKHTHDVELARRLMYAKLVEAYGPDYGGSPGRAVQVYVRIINKAPNSFAASEGWNYVFHEEDPPKSGAFKAVVFRC